MLIWVAGLTRPSRPMAHALGICSSTASYLVNKATREDRIEAIELPGDGDYDRYADRLLALVVACFDRLDLVRPQRASAA